MRLVYGQDNCGICLGICFVGIEMNLAKTMFEFFVRLR